ncbi:MAG: hypothetical protein IJ088_09350 [Clostridia bacterium]|nr:hypothetical protein [Clostridia bacterium]
MSTPGPEDVKMAPEKAEKIKEEIKALRFARMPDAMIKDAMTRRHDLTPTCVQNFMYEVFDPEAPKMETLKPIKRGQKIKKERRES